MRLMETDVPARRFLVLVLALLVLTLVANSGPVQWGDNGLYLSRAAQGPLFAPDLSEMSHPLFHLLSVATWQVAGPHGVALINGLLMPLVAWLAFGLARALGAPKGLATAATAAVLGMHAVLWVGTKVEVYALHLLLVLACWWVYARAVATGWTSRRLLGLGLLAGMALSVHQLTLIVLAPLAFAVPWQVRWRTAFAAGGFVLGLFACWPAFVHLREQSVPVFDIVHGFLTGGGASGGGAQGAHWESMFLRLDRLAAAPHLVGAVLLSLVGAGVFGLWRWPPAGPTRLMWLAAVMNLAFAVTYDVPDRFSFFLPGGALLAILGTLALAERQPAWLNRDRMFGIVLLPVLLTHLAPLVAADFLMTLPRVKTPAPGFNQLTYYFSPLTGDRSAEQFVARYEREVPVGAWVYADFISQNALISAQRAGRFAGRQVLRCSAFNADKPPAAPVYLVQALECAEPMRHVHARLAVGYLLGTRAAPVSEVRAQSGVPR